MNYDILAISLSNTSIGKENQGSRLELILIQFVVISRNSKQISSSIMLQSIFSHKKTDLVIMSRKECKEIFFLQTIFFESHCP
jgi:hypothetical protein